MTKIDVAALSNMELLQLVESVTVELKDREYHRGLTPTVEDVQEKIEREGLVLQKVDRLAREGDYIRPNDQKNHARFNNGEIYGPVRSFGENLIVGRHNFNVYTDVHNRTPETVEVFEVVGAIKEKIKSPNQQRAELIQRAREFYWGNLKGQHFLDDDTYVSFSNTNGYTASHDIDFVVNKEKRTVVALVKYAGKVTLRGIAKCMPGEVFNADIGKAIALARALQIEIPQEFLQAVQPTHYSVGQVITFPADDVDYMKMCYRVDSVSSNSELTMLFDDYGKAYGGDLTGSQFDKSEFRNILPIIDDTNANYEVTS